MSAPLKPELVDRMVALVRKMASQHSDDGRGRSVTTTSVADYKAAFDIASEFVDPDLIEARAIAVEILISHDAQTGRPDSTKEWRKSIEAGTDDSHPVVQSTLAALKRGRTLSLATPERE